MVGFDLKKQLKVHERSLLRQLFSKERAMRMVDWYLTPKNDIEPIAEAWENLQEDRKRHYQVVLGKPQRHRRLRIGSDGRILRIKTSGKTGCCVPATPGGSTRCLFST